MQLIGMPDSAFVRRVAITMQLLELPYEHHAISVLSTYQRATRGPARDRPGPDGVRKDGADHGRKTPAAHGKASVDDRIGQDGITVAVTWRFTQMLLPETVLPAAFPALAALSARAEQLPAFIAVPPL